MPVRRATKPDNLPTWIGPVEFMPFGTKWVAVRCPSDLYVLMRRSGGVWDPGGRRWLVEQRRLGPLIRDLRLATDPLFRRAGIDLDGRKPR